MLQCPVCDLSFTEVGHENLSCHLFIKHLVGLGIESSYPCWCGKAKFKIHHICRFLDHCAPGWGDLEQPQILEKVIEHLHLGLMQGRAVK